MQACYPLVEGLGGLDHSMVHFVVFVNFSAPVILPLSPGSIDTFLLRDRRSAWVYEIVGVGLGLWVYGSIDEGLPLTTVTIIFVGS